MSVQRVLCDERDHRWRKVGELDDGFLKQRIDRCVNCGLTRYHI